MSIFTKQPLFCSMCGKKFEASVSDSWHAFEKGVCGERCFYEKRRREYLSILNKPFNEDSEKPLSEMIDERIRIRALENACRAILSAHNELFVGLPLCIDGKPIDHTKLNEAARLAESALKQE